MRIVLGNDHRGIETKKKLITILEESGHEYNDLGTNSSEPVDYPDIARMVCKAVLNDGYDFGILVCDTGIGMSIAANKIKGIRAALCHDSFYAYRARLHNDANIMALGTRHSLDELREIVRSFLSTEFEGGRHNLRLEKIRKLEES